MLNDDNIHVTADDVLRGVDLSGKCAVVTGGSTGLGRETVRALAAAGADVLFTARDAAKAHRVAQELREETGKAGLHSLPLDLCLIESIDAFVHAALAAMPALDILILNAGMIAPDLRRTAQGIELQFMANFIGHQLLAAGLAPALIAGAPSRIVSLSSSAHKSAPVVFEDVHFDRRDYDPFTAYGQSKTACALLAVELNRRLAPRGVLAFSVHPGAIFETTITNGAGIVDESLSAEQMMALIGMRPQDRKTIPQGAATAIWAATAPALAATGGGHYLEDCRMAVTDDPYPHGGVSAHALDPAAARRLWTLGEQLTARTMAP